MSLAGTIGMGRRETGLAEQDDDGVERTIIATLRGTKAFKKYLMDAAKKDRCPVSLFLERAIIQRAQHLGIEDEPPVR